MKKERIKEHFLIYSIIISIILVSICIYRAYTTGITWDEAFTYLEYVTNNPFYAFKGLFINGPGNGIYTVETVIANNHMINTFLISIVTILTRIKYNVFLIRLPNILFYIVYLIFAYLLSKKYKHKYLCFNLLAFNYGIHEFFGLARGYGIACTLVLIAMYYLKIWIEDNSKYKYLNLCYLFLAISCYASTTCLLIFASILMLTQSYIMIDKSINENIKYIKKSLFFLIPISITTILIILFHFHVTTDGFNLYGGTNGFFQDTLLSLIELYGIYYFEKTILITIIISIVIIIYFNKQLLKNPLVYGSIIYFGLLIILTLVNNQLWLTKRLLIPSIPFLLIPIYEIVNILNIKKIIMVPLVILSIIPFLTIVNVNSTRDWNDNYVIKDIAYKSYYEKNSSLLKPYIDNYSACYYRNKIYEENNYDIYKGILSLNKICGLKKNDSQ